jgi:hypothetical protein
VKSTSRLIAALALAVVALPLHAQTSDTIDVDLWHADLLETLGEEPEEYGDRRPAIGIYPSLGGSFGLPGWVSAQGHVYLSFTDGKSFSLYGGYGEEWGFGLDSRIVTVGWGGVRPIDVASKQTGFHGKYLRYRSWDDQDHGNHRGFSFGTETGIGLGALAFEIGAARSQRNHWLIVAQIQVKLAYPVRIPLTRNKAVPDGN